MEHVTFRHLGRDWEAAIPQAAADPLPVRFQEADGRGPESRQAHLSREELDVAEPAERELALRRGLESALVLNALAGATQGLSAEEVADRTGMPVDAAEDRLHVLDSVQPVPGSRGTIRYRAADAADSPPGGSL